MSICLIIFFDKRIEAWPSNKHSAGDKRRVVLFCFVLFSGVKDPGKLLRD